MLRLFYFPSKAKLVKMTDDAQAWFALPNRKKNCIRRVQWVSTLDRSSVQLGNPPMCSLLAVTCNLALCTTIPNPKYLIWPTL